MSINKVILLGRVGKNPDIKDIKEYCNEQVATLWDEVKRFENPHSYYVDLSQKLWEEKKRLLDNFAETMK